MALTPKTDFIKLSDCEYSYNCEIYLTPQSHLKFDIPPQVKLDVFLFTNTYKKFKWKNDNTITLKTKLNSMYKY